MVLVESLIHLLPHVLWGHASNHLMSKNDLNEVGGAMLVIAINATRPCPQPYLRLCGIIAALPLFDMNSGMLERKARGR